MPSYEQSFAAVGVHIPDILVPRAEVDLSKWAVIACDQFTSERDYWGKVEQIVGDEPSTLRLIYPEAYLGDPDRDERIDEIRRSMDAYLAGELLEELPSTAVLVRRETRAGTIRWGLMLALDLDQYSTDDSARSLIRATEGTLLDRLPPRVAVRRESPLELPHIMVLIDDPDRSVIEPLRRRSAELRPIYSTHLMLGGGRVQAWAVDHDDDLQQIAQALTRLREALDESNPLLFAMGDGNHSFATAQALWQETRQDLSPAEAATHPARHCLVEVENIFDPGIVFEPIHRVIFGCDRRLFEATLSRECARFDRRQVADLPTLTAALTDPHEQCFGFVDADGYALYTLTGPSATIAAGTLQRAIDTLPEGVVVDYVHGAEATERLGRRPGNLGLLLPPVDKDSFFTTLIRDGALPRKTFSMGDAEDKRYYLEARRIK